MVRTWLLDHFKLGNAPLYFNNFFPKKKKSLITSSRTGRGEKPTWFIHTYIVWKYLLPGNSLTASFKGWDSPPPLFSNIYLDIFNVLNILYTSGNLQDNSFFLSLSFSLRRQLSKLSVTKMHILKKWCKIILQYTDWFVGLHYSWALLPSSVNSVELPGLTAAGSSEFPDASESTLERLNLRSGYWLLSKGMRWTQRTWVFKFPFWEAL